MRPGHSPITLIACSDLQHLNSADEQLMLPSLTTLRDYQFKEDTYIAIQSVSDQGIADGRRPFFRMSALMSLQKFELRY